MDKDLLDRINNFFSDPQNLLDSEESWNCGQAAWDEAKRLRDRYETQPGKCNSGHTGLPICLWDCPECARLNVEQAGEAMLLRIKTEASCRLEHGGDLAGLLAWLDFLKDGKPTPPSNRIEKEGMAS